MTGSEGGTARESVEDQTGHNNINDKTDDADSEKLDELGLVVAALVESPILIPEVTVDIGDGKRDSFEQPIESEDYSHFQEDIGRLYVEVFCEKSDFDRQNAEVNQEIHDAGDEEFSELPHNRPNFADSVGDDEAQGGAEDEERQDGQF